MYNTFIVVKNDISKDCYTFDFTDDKMREDLGGFVLMDANYLKDLKFDGEALSFSTDRGVKITIL